jgi:hypothetical protein
MKKTLITTTIRVPKVLELYRKFDPEVTILVAGDRKTPHDDVRSFVNNLGNSTYYSDKDQENLGYSCSDVIGWNNVQRRNIALLEALKLHPDIIVTIDDDNLPLNREYFLDFERIFGSEYDGLVAKSEIGWFNICTFLGGGLYHRGFPFELKHTDPKVVLEARTKVKIGVAAGLWLGDPDIDAIERIENRPIVNQIPDLLRAGIAVDSGCYSPFNSQNTAYLAEVAPLMLMITEMGRYDDIWAAYISERIMRESGYHVHFGRPIVWQERNPHNLLADLKNEILGMEHTRRFCEDLDSMDLGDGSLTDKLFRLFELTGKIQYIPEKMQNMQKLGVSWCKDLEKVL